MARSPQRERPTAHDEQVRAVVGALAPATMDYTKLRARAANSDDVRPIRVSKRDLLAAFGMAPRLGQLVWRTKWNRERSPELLLSAALLLMEKLRGSKATRQRRPSVTLRLVALTAMAEFIESDPGGDRVLTDHQRARNLGVDIQAYLAGWSTRYQKALDLLATAEQVTSRAIDLRTRRSQTPTRVSENSYEESESADTDDGEPEQDQAKATSADGPK